MILSTTPQIEGHSIREYKGIVTGETIIGANMFKDLFAGIRDIVGGRAGAYEKVLSEGLNAHGSHQRNGCSHLNQITLGNIHDRFSGSIFDGMLPA